VLVALAFGAFQAADVVVATWLQDAVNGRARATVTSVAALGAELVAVLVYTLDGALAGRVGDGAAMALLAGLYLPVALVTWRAPAETAVTATGVAARMTR
jgi:hypothetical protein